MIAMDFEYDGEYLGNYGFTICSTNENGFDTITTDSQVREGCLVINIDYTVRSSNVKDNLVFPFYLNATAEEEAYEPEQYESEELE